MLGKPLPVAEAGFYSDLQLWPCSHLRGSATKCSQRAANPEEIPTGDRLEETRRISYLAPYLILARKE